LKDAIKDDPSPKDKERLGKGVGKWIGGMVTKASMGAWEIGVSKAGEVLANAIAHYYGLP
jgi:hypothetical protein